MIAIFLKCFKAFDRFKFHEAEQYLSVRRKTVTNYFIAHQSPTTKNSNENTSLVWMQEHVPWKPAN